MEFALTSNIKIIDLCLLIDKTLIISDIHIGYEEELNKKGILIPRLSFIEIGKRLEKIMKEVKGKIDTIIINGDIKHEFGTISVAIRKIISRKGQPRQDAWSYCR